LQIHGKKMKILKFGGSSLSSKEGLSSLSATLRREYVPGQPLPVVVSALENATNSLLAMCHLASVGNAEYFSLYSQFETRHVALIEAVIEDPARAIHLCKNLFQDLQNLLQGISLVRDISPKTLDFVMSFGERLAVIIVSEYLRPDFPDCRALDAREVIKTDDSFGAAQVDFAQSGELIRQEFARHPLLTLVTGFIASTQNGETSTLGRGGSDFTAAVLAVALGASEIEFWTSVDGVMTADPKKVNRAFTIPELSYDEALELCHFGARVIFAPAMQPAMTRKIPIRIKNTFRPERPGSLISDAPPLSPRPISGISSISNIALFQLQGSGLIGVTGTARRLFDALSRADVNVILISQASSEHSICFAVSPEAAHRARTAVEDEFSFELEARQIELESPESEHCIIAVVGASMRNTRGISGKLFQALGKNGINVAAIAQGSSELNISVVINRSDESKALNALHDAFFLSDVKTLHLFLVGTGQVGKTLIEQIQSHREMLRRQKLEVRLIGAANSRHMVFHEQGIAFDKWKEALDASDREMDIVRFVEQIQELNLPNSIFVDCTASDEVAAAYSALLRSSISVVTPNKRANSGSSEQYLELKERARKANVKFFYETNVGAGLPIIGTLNDLIASGDEILRIEAVLSGTLSYIFNSYMPGQSFSDIVREAKAKGYTEPDPRDDLSGRDVARKLLILGREIGLTLEEADIRVESLVPPSCRNAATVDDFFAALRKEDKNAAALLENAARNGKVLRYIGSIENGSAQVSLQAVGADHPFYSLSGSDNIVSFTTKRYLQRPLVVKGPGAGTDVTAAGVFADIIRAASYLI
jgi:aspartokinase/homoserine dehydrogenase 1